VSRSSTSEAFWPKSLVHSIHPISVHTVVVHHPGKHGTHWIHHGSEKSARKDGAHGLPTTDRLFSIWRRSFLTMFGYVNEWALSRDMKKQ